MFRNTCQDLFLRVSDFRHGDGYGSKARDLNAMELRKGCNR